jgi:hypothetical protein
MERLLNEETDQDFLNKQARLEAFHERFKGFSGKTTNEFSDKEMKQYVELIKELFNRHEQMKSFLEAVESVQSDTMRGTYI